MALASVVSYYDNSTITQLDGAISSTPSAGATTSVTVDSTNNFHASQYIVIDSEEMTVSSITNATQVVLTRGVNGTTVATHSDDATVKSASLWQDVVQPGTTKSALLDLEISEYLGSERTARIIIQNATSSPKGGSGGAAQGAYTPVFKSYTPIRVRDGENGHILFYGIVYNVKEIYTSRVGMTIELNCYDHLHLLKDVTTAGEYGYNIDTAQALSKFADYNDSGLNVSNFQYASAASSRGGLIKSLIAQNVNIDNITFANDSNRFTESVRKFQDSFTYQLGERGKKSVLAHIRELSNDDPTAAAGGNFGFDYYGDPNFTSTATNHKPALFFNYFKRGNRPSTEPEKYGARFAQPYTGFLKTGRSQPIQDFVFENPKEEIYTDAKVTFPSFSNSATTSRAEKTVDFELLQISDYAIVQYTTLNEALDDSETAIDVSDASSGNSASQAIIAGMTIRVDDEEMYVSSVSTNTLTVVRGVNYTTAAAHDNSTAVKSAFTWGNPNNLMDKNYYGTLQALHAPERLDVQLTQLDGAHTNTSSTAFTVDSTAGMYVNQMLFIATSATAGAREYIFVTAVNSNGTDFTATRAQLGTSAVTHVDNSYVFSYDVATMQYISRTDTSGGNDITASAPAFVMISDVRKAIMGTATKEAHLSVGSIVRGHYNYQTNFTILSRPKTTHLIKRTLNITIGSSSNPNNIREEVAARLMRSTSEVTRGMFFSNEKPYYYVDATPTAVGSSSSATVQGTTKYTETLTFGKVLVTTLNEALDDSETAIDVISSDEMYVGQTFQIDSEKFVITAINSSTNISANRAQSSTSAAEHDTGTQIYDISANPLNFGIRIGTTLNELDSNSKPTSTYGYASAVTSTQVTGTWDTGQISTSSVVRYYVPIRVGDILRLRNDLTNIDQNCIITKACYYELNGQYFTQYEVAKSSDSNVDLPIRRLSGTAALAEQISRDGNLPVTGEVQGASTSSQISPNPVTSVQWTAPGEDNAYLYRLQADATIGSLNYVKGDMLFVNITTGDIHFVSDVKGSKSGLFDLGDNDGANWTNLYVEAIAFESTSNTYQEFAGIQAPANYSSGNSDTARYVLTLPSSGPSADSFLHSDSSGVLTFVAASSVGGPSVNGAGTNRIAYSNSDGSTLNFTEHLMFDGVSTFHAANAGEADAQGGFYYPNARFKNTGRNTDGGGGIEIWHDTSSPADSDQVGFLNFYGTNSAGTKVEYAHIRAISDDVTDSTRDGSLAFRTTYNASGTTANTDATLTAAGVWTDSSDEKYKTYEGTAHSIYGGTDGKVITDKLKSLNVGRYYGKGTPSDKISTSEKHISPTAQDFYDLFGTGTEKTGKGYTTTKEIKDIDGNVTSTFEQYHNAVLSPKDMAGVALMAIKELIARVEALES